MTENSEQEVSESQIAVHWREEGYYPPPPAFVQQANANDPAIFDRFTEDKFPDCFTEYADLLHWDRRLPSSRPTSPGPTRWRNWWGSPLPESVGCTSCATTPGSVASED